MPNRFRVRSFALLLVGAFLVRNSAAAQGTLADRLKKIADDEKRSLLAEANRQVNSVVTDAAAANVADGTFSAAFSPWASSDGTKRVEIARYGGSAFAVTTNTGRQIVLCDDRGILAWSASFTILDKAPGAVAGGRGAPAAMPAPGAGRGAAAGGATPAGRGASAPPPPPPPPPAGAPGRGAGGSPSGRGGGTGSAGGRGGGASGAGGGTADNAAGGGRGASANASTGPTMNQREFRFPSPQVTVTLPTAGPKTGVAASGSIRVGDLSQDIFVGAAKVRFNSATIPGEKTPQVVDYGVAFKARVLPVGEQPAGCAVGGAKSAVATTGRGAAPVPGRSAADTVSAAASGRSPAGPTTGAAFAEGDVLTPRIATINLLAAAQDSAKVAGVLKKGDELVFLGQEQDGYLHVSNGTSEGWVRKVLVSKR
jgi:hypothetical protein